jgi:TRAP-type C4-dicarboxylate transport system substrate-binding protein
MEVFELPGIVYNSAKVATRVSTELVKEYNPKEIQDTKIMFISSTGPAFLSTKVPVTKLEDLKGVQLRTTGLSAKAATALGAVPVAIPMSEAYEALSKGVAQGIIAPTEALQGYKLAEVTGNVTKTPFIYCALFYVTMNRNVWNSLPPEMQKAIENVNEKFNEEVVSGLFDRLNEAGLKNAVEKNGVKVYTLPAEESSKWIKLLEPVQEESVAALEKNGLPGRELLDKVKKLAGKYNEFYK